MEVRLETGRKHQIRVHKFFLQYLAILLGGVFIPIVEEFEQKG